MKNMQKRDYHYTKQTYAVMAALGAFGAERKAHMESHPEKNPLSGIDIDAEYEKIKAKTSTLPRMTRDLIAFFALNKEEIQKYIDRAAERDAIESNPESKEESDVATAAD